MRGTSNKIEFEEKHGMYELSYSSSFRRMPKYTNNVNTYLIPQEDVDKLIFRKIPVLSEVYRVTSKKENGVINAVRLLGNKYILPEISAVVFSIETSSLFPETPNLPIEQLVADEELNGFRIIGEENINGLDF